MHEYIPVIILVVGLFAGIWINRRDFADLKTDMNRQFNDSKIDVQRQFDTVNRRIDRMDEEIKKRLDRIDGDLREFYGTDKQLEGRINELSARIK